MKVLFLDTWTKGIRMFLPIKDYLHQKSIECLLVHWGSWEAEQGRPREEYIDGLLVRDMAYYKTRLLHKVMKREKPDCVVMLTTNNIMDRAKILSARALGIPSVFLMHGILAATDSAIDAQIKVIEDTLRKKRFSTIPKYLKYVLPNYFISGIAEKRLYLFTREPYGVVWNTFRHPEKWKMYPAPSREIQCDRCLAWGKAYKDFLCEAYGYPPDSVVVTGHPPLDSACQLAASPPSREAIDAFLRSNGIDASKPMVVYIEGCFVKSQYEGWTDQSLLEHLREMADLSDRVGRTLVVKMHPNSKNDKMLEERLRGRATILRAIDTNMLFYASESVIAHSSTLVNTALVFDRPVFIPRWGISKVIPPNYDDTGAVVVCEKPSELLQGLSFAHDSIKQLREGRDKYVQNYLAPLDGQSQQRICEAIVRLAQGKLS